MPRNDGRCTWCVYVRACVRACRVCHARYTVGGSQNRRSAMPWPAAVGGGHEKSLAATGRAGGEGGGLKYGMMIWPVLYRNPTSPPTAARHCSANVPTHRAIRPSPKLPLIGKLAIRSRAHAHAHAVQKNTYMHIPALPNPSHRPRRPDRRGPTLYRKRAERARAPSAARIRWPVPSSSPPLPKRQAPA
jgi:hypothetical protein